MIRTLLKMAAATKPDNRHGAPSVGEEPLRFLAQVDVHHIERHLVDDLSRISSFWKIYPFLQQDKDCALCERTKPGIYSFHLH